MIMKITNNTSRDMSVLTKTLESFIPYTQERLGYEKPFQVFFESDEECEISYKDRDGKYQGQKGVTLPKI